VAVSPSAGSTSAGPKPAFSRRPALPDAFARREDQRRAPPPAADIRVVDVPDRSRFEIHVDGEVAGFSEYHRSLGSIAFFNTLTDPRFEGQGLASRLVRTASRCPAAPCSCAAICTSRRRADSTSTRPAPPSAHVTPRRTLYCDGSRPGGGKSSPAACGRTRRRSHRHSAVLRARRRQRAQPRRAAPLPGGLAPGVEGPRPSRRPGGGTARAAPRRAAGRDTPRRRPRSPSRGCYTPTSTSC
jgi:GNAT superfamily N-acetyltransferase